MIELRKGRVPIPTLVRLRRAFVEQVEAAFIRSGIFERSNEPLVRIAGVIRGQVGDEPNATLMGGGREPRQRRVPAEQRVDVIEARCVIPMR